MFVNLADETVAGMTGTVIGWGQLELDGKSAEELQQVELPIMDNETCKKKSLYQRFEITENMFCAGFMKGMKDACKVTTHLVQCQSFV